MNRGFPSMTALLGLLAIAGYQNRDKLAELFREAQAKYGASGPGGSQEGRAGTVGNLAGILSGTSVGGLLSGGLRDLSRVSNPAVKAKSRILGLELGRTSQSRHRNSRARSVQRSGPHYPSTPGCPDRSSCRGCRGSCLRPSTSTRRRADFPHPPKINFPAPVSREFATFTCRGKDSFTHRCGQSGSAWPEGFRLSCGCER
jgi:hypothetical protein